MQVLLAMVPSWFEDDHPWKWCFGVWFLQRCASYIVEDGTAIVGLSRRNARGSASVARCPFPSVVKSVASWIGVILSVWVQIVNYPVVGSSADLRIRMCCRRVDVSYWSVRELNDWLTGGGEAIWQQYSRLHAALLYCPFIRIPWLIYMRWRWERLGCLPLLAIRQDGILDLHGSEFLHEWLEHLEQFAIPGCFCSEWCACITAACVLLIIIETVIKPIVQTFYLFILKRLSQLIPVVDWHKLTYLVLTCRKTPINQLIYASINMDYAMQWAILLPFVRFIWNSQYEMFGHWLAVWADCPLTACMQVH